MTSTSTRSTATRAPSKWNRKSATHLVEHTRRSGEDGPKYREMTVTADFAKGSSGAPVLDRTGAVVGIVRRTSPAYAEQKNGVKTNVQMVWKRCVPSSALFELLQEPSK